MVLLKGSIKHLLKVPDVCLRTKSMDKNSGVEQYLLQPIYTIRCHHEAMETSRYTNIGAERYQELDTSGYLDQ